MKLVQESLNFERGQDPKASLKIGFGKYSNEFGDGVSKALIKLKPYLDKYGFKMDEEDLEPPIRLIFSNDNEDEIRIAQRNTLGDGIHGVRVEFSLWNGLIFFDPTTKFENEQVEKMNPEEIFQKHFGNPIKEGLNFERGNFPKKALKIGMTELLQDMEEKFKKYYPGVISPNSYFHTDKKTGDGDAFFAHLLSHSVFWNRTVREFFENDPYFELISYEPLDVNSSGASDDAILKIKFNPNKLKESLNFEKGHDPIKTLNVGRDRKVKAGDQISVFYNGKNYIVTAVDDEKESKGEVCVRGGDFCREPEFESRTFKRISIRDKTGEIFTAEAKESWDNEGNTIWPWKIDKWDRPVLESINFERGMEPKKAMKVGLKSPRKFENIEDFTHYILAALPLIFGGRIPHDILSSKENGIIPQSYFDKICFWLSDKGFQMPNGNSDWANTENTDPDFIHWPEPIIKELENQLGEKRWQPY